MGHMRYPYLVVVRGMNPAFRLDVIASAVNYRRSATREAGKALNECIRRDVKGAAGGWAKHPENAPTTVLVAGIDQVLLRKNAEPLARAVLRVWAEAKAALQAPIGEYLEARGHAVRAEPVVEAGFDGAWPRETMITLGEAYAEAHTDVTFDDAALMMCLLVGRAPSGMAGVGEPEAETIAQAPGADAAQAP